MAKPALHGRDHSPKGQDPLRYGGWVLKVFSDLEAVTTGDGLLFAPFPEEWDGFTVKHVFASVSTVSSSGALTVQLHNDVQAVDMLSTAITIDANLTHSKFSVVQAVIVEANAQVFYGEQARVDVDTAGTGAEGLSVGMRFEL